MKLITIPTILIIALSIISCGNRSNDKFIVDIQIPPGEYDSIACYFSQDSIAAYSLWPIETCIFDSTGNIHMEVERDEITWFFITLYPWKSKDNVNGSRNRIFMLAQPGESYKILLDSNHPLHFRITGDCEEAQNLYNTFSQTEVNNHPGTNWLTNTDSVPEFLLQHLKDSIQIAVAPFKRLYDQGRVDQEFYQTALTQIEYAHARAFIYQLRVRQEAYKKPEKRRFPGVIPLKISDPELIRIMDKVLTSYPVSKKDARMAPALKRNIDYFLSYKSWTDSNVNTLSDSVVTWGNSSYSEKMKRINLADKYLEEDLVEQYFAHQFGSSSLKSGTDSLATYLYPEFKKRYPNSRFMPGVVRHIHQLTSFHTAFYPGMDDSKNNDASITEKRSYIFSPEIKFIEVQDTISSLASLLSHFRGMNLYIDFWASWCPPCRYEFRFKDSVQSYLDDLGIEILYISTDTEEDKWLNTINNYNLKGYHFRISNQELKREINSLLHFIPTYWIVDSTGSVINFEAERPHTKSKLYEQLVNSFN